MLPLPVMVSLPAMPSNSLKVAGVLPHDAGPGPAGRDIGVAEARAADRLDRGSVSLPTPVPLTVPAAMSTVIAPVASV